MEILYSDNDIIVCVKPARVLSTDEPGGLPDLLRQELGNLDEDIRTVHRLDRATGGLMVLARNAKAASELSRQIREEGIGKEYLTVVHGLCPEQGSMRDLLYRDKARKMTFVADVPSKETREALLDYKRLGYNEDMSLVAVRLHTGRTHQIRCQFASRGLPLVGERKYAELNDPCELALFSCALEFTHPSTGEKLRFSKEPPGQWPWNSFSKP
jgi:23S rRNA pseudouridine1911/1915/1917 synthase